jgi:excisionase family DNA binding protein
VTDIAAVFGPDAVAAIEAFVDARVEARLATLELGRPRRPWLTVAEAAEVLGCSPDAVRMRARRGRLETRRQGRRLYVAARSVESLEP